MALLPSDQDYPEEWIDDLVKTFVTRRPMFPDAFFKPLCRLGREPGIVYKSIGDRGSANIEDSILIGPENDDGD